MGSIASIGVYLLGVAQPIWENISGAGSHRWTELIRGRNCKESWIVAYENIFVNFMCKLVFPYFIMKKSCD